MQIKNHDFSYKLVYIVHYSIYINSGRQVMKTLLTLTILSILSIGSVKDAKADNFDWLNDLNIQATTDPSGFRVRLGTRFQLGGAQVNAVINRVSALSDAYMVLRLGELSHRPLNDVLDVYASGRDKGWGKMAKELGVKPGSSEFHALKRGHDLDHAGQHHSKKPKGKDKKKNKGKDKKNKGKH